MINEIVPSKISNLVKRQFDDWYLENGPNFVGFVQAYYQWLESTNNPLYFSRNVYNIKDIDLTFDQFIVFFKEKYLKNIQLSTQTDTRTLIKHALDIYRSKGSQRSVKLLFQLVFDKDVKFYYPSTDLMRLSDGYWFKPIYLELALDDKNTNIVNKQVKGLNSGAIAFVDAVVRRSTKGRLQDVAYISALSGNFQVNEKIQPTDGSITITQCPSVTGSLTNVDIIVSGVGQGFEIGDTVNLSSQYGEDGKGLVTSTIDQFGIIIAALHEGGYGYRGVANVTANSTVDTIYISNTMFTFSNVQITIPGTIQYFQQFDKFSQAQAWLNYNSANGNFALNDDVFTYNVNNSVKGHGVVVAQSVINSSAGAVLVGIVSGNMNDQHFFTTSNIVTANLNASNGYFQANATGKFVANDTFLTIDFANASGTFAVGEKVIQPTGKGFISKFVDANTMVLVNTHGIFYPNYTLTGLISGAVANIASISIGVGVSNTSGSFYSFANNLVTCNNVQGTITRIELGDSFAIGVANNLLYPETVLMNTDLLNSYLSTNINALSYGFPANTSANLTSVIVANALSYVNVTIGKIQTAIVANPGQNYTKPPFIVLDGPGPRALQYHNNGFVLNLTGATGTFQFGDVVTQIATNARGFVLGDDDLGNLIIQNMRFYQNNRFVVTSNSTTIVTSSAGVTANLTAISIDDSPDVMGHNLHMDANFAIGNGAVLTLKVTDSGFGFMEDDDVILNSNNLLLGIGRVINQGIGSGYYKEKGGFLSDQKKLFDGYFWQNYSYEIISALVINKYEKMLKQLSHPAGTIMFGQLQHDSFANNTIEISSQFRTL